MPVVDSYVGLKIRRLQFLAVAMIVAIHSTFLSTNVIVWLLTQWAVPFFLCVSGCLFSVSMERNSAVEIVRKKSQTLVVPYVFWVTLGWITLGSGDVWRAYGITTAMPTGLGVFWFVRQLVVSMSVLLALEGLVKLVGFRKWRRLISACVYCVVFLATSRIKWIVAMPASPFWFVLGYALAPVLLENRARDMYKLSWIWAVSSFLVAVVVRCCCCQVTGAYEVLVRNGCDILVMAALWFLYDGVFKGRAVKTSKWGEALLACTFGVYAVHVFALHILRGFPPFHRLVLALLGSVAFVLVSGWLCPRSAESILGGRIPRLRGGSS